MQFVLYTINVLLLYYVDLIISSYLILSYFKRKLSKLHETGPGHQPRVLGSLNKYLASTDMVKGGVSRMTDPW